MYGLNKIVGKKTNERANNTLSQYSTHKTHNSLAQITFPVAEWVSWIKYAFISIMNLFLHSFLLYFFTGSQFLSFDHFYSVQKRKKNTFWIASTRQTFTNSNTCFFITRTTTKNNKDFKIKIVNTNLNWLSEFWDFKRPTRFSRS